MTVERILQAKGRAVKTAQIADTLVDAARQLKAERIGAVVVVGADGGVEGILSERDIAHAVASHGAKALEMTVGNAMTRAVITCTRTEKIDDVMSKMTGRRIRHLPVIEDGRLCGMVSIGDVVKSKIEDVEAEAAALRGFISGG